MRETPTGPSGPAPYSRTAAWVALAMALPALLLAGPGRTVTTIYLNDLLIFLDGAHRVMSGQVPSRDYHTPIGALADLLPAAGLLVTGHLGSAMPAGFALLILALTPATAHVLASRLRPSLAIPVALHLSIVLAAPMNLGDAPTHLSFAMFYNRIGWAALALLLVMYLPPLRAGRLAADGLSAGLLACVMVYTKISYGAVALAFLIFMLADRRQRDWAAMALALALLVTLAAEAAWSLPSAYLADIAMAAQASGTVQGGAAELVRSAARNLTDYVAFLLAAALALAAAWNTRDFLFWGFCGVTGLLILNQNFQQAGIVTLAAGVAVAAELAARRQPPREGPSAGTWPGGLYVLLLVLVVPQFVGRAAGLGYHAAQAVAAPADVIGLPNLGRIALVDAEGPAASHYGYSLAYARTIGDGAALLRSRDAEPGHVVVLDYVNPFSSGLGIPPSRGDSSWNFLGRNFSRSRYVPPAEYLGAARFVMVPRKSLNPPTTRALMAIHGDYLARHFERAAESGFWTLYERRRRPAGEAGQGMAPLPP